jgi:hypothetical protein
MKSQLPIHFIQISIRILHVQVIATRGKSTENKVVRKRTPFRKHTLIYSTVIQTIRNEIHLRLGFLS